MSRKIEWNYVVGGLILGLIWFLFGNRVLVEISNKFGVILGYSIFLFLYFAIAILLGSGIHKKTQTVVVFIAGIILFDLVTPPILIDYLKQPSPEVLSMVSSDVYFYSIALKFGASHTQAWIFTYPFMVLFSMLVFTFFLTKRQMKRTILNQLGR